MSKKRRRHARQPQKSQKPQNTYWLQIAIIAGVVLLVAIVLILKNQTAGPSAVAESQSQATATLVEAEGQAQTTATLAEAEDQTQATAVLEQVESQAPATASPNELPEAQLERLLAAGQPTLAFFHSNNCVQCIKMMRIVEQVYPEFAASVALVDVNVYDQSNASLLQRAGIRAIPTQIFFNRDRQGQVVMGAMDPDQFRQQLQTLAGGQ